MSKQYVEADYVNMENMEDEDHEMEVVQLPKRNLLHKLADLAYSAGNKLDDKRKAKAEKKAAEEALNEEEGEKKRRSKFKKILIGGLGAAALTGVAALTLSRMSRDQELVTWVPDEGSDEFNPDDPELRVLDEAEDAELTEDVEVQQI